jgi:hypothetical protein
MKVQKNPLQPERELEYLQEEDMRSVFSIGGSAYKKSREGVRVFF